MGGLEGYVEESHVVGMREGDAAEVRVDRVGKAGKEVHVLDQVAHGGWQARAWRFGHHARRGERYVLFDCYITLTRAHRPPARGTQGVI